jgi:hypothetical protein
MMMMLPPLEKNRRRELHLKTERGASERGKIRFELYARIFLRFFHSELELVYERRADRAREREREKRKSERKERLFTF